ncbi:hypothetical protein AAHC03_09639 [Spirometra sp. Aus1]
MRTYVPPKQLQISEINKSWEILNVAEHSRGLALHDELIRLERLEQLFIKFEKKCSLREAWLKENEQLIHQELPEFSVYALQTSLKKHEALEADINAYEDRIQMIVHISNELQRSNYHRLPFVLSRLNFIIEMWHRLLEALRSHRLTLEARLNECYDAIEHDHLLLLTEDLQSKIERIPLGSSEMETEHSIKMLENIQLDFRPLGIRVRHLGRIGANLQVVYEELVKKGEEKKKLLRRTEQKWHIQRELKSETAWAQEKLNLLSEFLKSVTATRCNAFLRKHKIIEGEIQAEEPNITFLLELSQEVIREDLQNASNVEQAAISLKNRWNELIVLASDIKRQLSAVSQVLSMLPDIEDAEEWITEKRSQLLEASASLPTIRDLYAAEKAVKKNQELLESVESFKSTINALKIRSYEFMNSNRRLLKELQTKSAGIGEENLNNAIQVHENVEKLISKRLEKLYACFEDLIELTKGNQAMLIDAFAIHQLFHSASSIYLWIAEKDHILGCIPMIDISVLDLRHIDADVFTDFEAIKHRLDELEGQMGQIAVQVSTVNQSAENLTRAAICEEETIFTNTATFDQISSLRDHLNSAWNQLADRVEELRSQLTRDYRFLALCQDCNETVSWINEKNAVIVALDQIDVSVSTGLLRLQSGLNAMQSDVVAIRAKVDDIGARIRTDFVLESSSPISFRDRCKWLTAEHRHLEHMLSELETEVQSRIDRLSTNNKLLKHVDDLNSLLSWMAAERDRYCDLSVPANLADVERMLSEQEKNLESIYAVDENVRNILSDRRIFAGTSSLEDRDIALAIRAEQLSEEWEDLCKLAKLRLDNLKRQKLVQTFFAEAAALEVLISQQDSFLLKQDIPASVEVAEALIREHRAFTASLRACANRLAALTRSGTELAAQDMPNHDRILNRLSALESRLNNNIEKSELRGRTLEENFRLQKFFRDVEEIEDWISEKSLVLDSLSTFAKHDVVSLFTRVQALQDEIEISRETADKVIKTGHQLVDEYAHLEAPVSERTEQLRLHWDDLVQKTQEATLSLSQSQTELFVNEASKTILDWADDLTKRLEAKDGDATTGMTDLQSRLAAHNNDLRTMDENLNLLEEIKDYVGMLSRRNPQRAEELRIVVDTLTKRLTDLKNLLSDRGQELEAQKAIALCLLELNTELLWARDKLTAIRPPYTEWPTSDARRPPGVQLLAAQRRGRRLDRYRIEVENRAPRVKQLCQKAERDYLSREAQKRIGSRAASFKNVLAELDEVWFILNHVLKVRIEEVQLVEAINKYVFDATDILAWISERELYLNSLERPTNVEENDRALRRLRILSGIVRHWTEEVSSTVTRGRKLNQDLRRGVQVDDEVVSVNEAARSVVTTFADRVKEAFDALCDAISGKTRELGEASELHDLLIDLVDLEEWIAKRHLTASSHDVGTDLEHCFMLRSRFSDFVVETKHEGGRRMKTAIARCDGLIARGHPNRSEVATCKDRLNEAWADLLEMMDTRQQLLKSALDMHRFYSDAQDLEEQIQHRYDTLPPEPSADLVTGRLAASCKRGLASLQRSHAALEKDLVYLSERVSQFSRVADHLYPVYAGERQLQLLTRRNAVLEAWRGLASVADQRGRSLLDCYNLHRFIATARDLLEWMEEKKEEMSHPSTLSRNVTAVERLVAEHRQLHSELEAKAERIDDCLCTGRALLEAPSREVSGDAGTGFSPLYLSMVGPRGEVRELCVLLATERVITNELWRERWDRLQMLLDVRYFIRDADTCDAWLNSRETYLVGARRKFGESLSDTIALLGAHYAFMRACAGAEARFDALKRLTQLEIRAMEWRPEDANYHEMEKRENIRRAVQEFMPSSSNSTNAGRRPLPAVVRPQPRQLSSVSVAPHFTLPGRAAQSTQATADITMRPFMRAVPATRSVPIPRARSSELRSSSASRSSAAGIVRLPPTGPSRQAGTSVESASSRQSTESLQRSEPFFPRQGRSLSQLQQRQAMGESPRRSLAETEMTVTPLRQERPTRDLEERPAHRRDSQRSINPSGSRNGTSQKTPSESHVSSDEELRSRRPEVHQARRASSTMPSNIPVAGPSRPDESSSSAAAEEPLPKLEGPLVRKWDLDAGGARHPRSKGRGWTPIYVTLSEGQLTSYRDQRTRRERVEDTFGDEAPLDLTGARAAPALDYSKKRWVFRLRLFTGAEYLFQAVTDEVLVRWVSAINNTAHQLNERARLQQGVRISHRALSLPTRGAHSMTRGGSSTSTISQSGGQPETLRKRYGSFQRLFRRK